MIQQVGTCSTSSRKSLDCVGEENFANQENSLLANSWILLSAIRYHTEVNGDPDARASTWSEDDTRVVTFQTPVNAPAIVAKCVGEVQPLRPPGSCCKVNACVVFDVTT